MEFSIYRSIYLDARLTVADHYDVLKRSKDENAKSENQAKIYKLFTIPIPNPKS